MTNSRELKPWWSTKRAVAPAASPKDPAKNSKEKWDRFAALDNDKNGSVTEEEWLKRVQASRKKKNKPYDEAQEKKTFARIDADSNGSITREELETGGRK